MTARELDAAGVHEPGLRAAYQRCRELNARHGKTYFLATRLLTAPQRPAVHALYGFARWADDIVDDTDSRLTPGQRDRALTELDAQLRSALRHGHGGHPVITALADTARRYRIDPRHFTDFMRSMRMDLHITGYRSLEDLHTYMHGSAAVIGLQVLPVLGTVVPRAEAAPHAASLGISFQLTNFLRDVGEDLDRGRVYLPGDRLAAHGVDRGLLRWCRRTGRDDP
ncbi:phytoene/squalene synthase family protein, partial [Streptomyces sp. NPDC048845]|uniref:phytoene/squalene synthase family protein n=1 Tax=Streptomyces sp. NPDC048845 TaxID=3155390 RepID=UPI00343E0705